MPIKFIIENKVNIIVNKDSIENNALSKIKWDQQPDWLINRFKRSGFYLNANFKDKDDGSTYFDKYERDGSAITYKKIYIKIHDLKEEKEEGPSVTLEIERFEIK